MQWIVLALVLLFCLGCLWLIYPARRRHPDRALLTGAFIAHRGLHSLSPDTPENSLPAFRAAMEQGFVIETDLRLTADGEIILFHDDSLSRLCGLSCRPEEMTLSQLRRLHIGNSDQTIPTLRELLGLVDGRVPILLEFKVNRPGLCARLCRTAEEMLADYRGKYFIQSFYPPVLFWYRRHRREVCRGQLSAGYFAKKVFGARLLSCLLFNFLGRPDFVSYKYQTARHFCRRLCIRLGAHSVGWTFRSQAELDSCRGEFSAFVFENFLPQK